MDRKAQSVAMTSTVEYAYTAEKSGHRFGLSDGGKRLKRNAPSPKLSRSGQYYLDCQTCKRTVFENGSGSAVTQSCER